MTTIRPRLCLIALILGAFLPQVTTAADAKDNWTKHCTRCHGDDGVGNTKAGRKLHIKNLTSPGVQSRLTDTRIQESLTDGVQSDDGEEKMPSFKEKLSEAERKDLVSYIRSLGKEKS